MKKRWATAAAACLPCTITDGSDPRPLWRLALSAFEELLSVTPVPLLLEPVAPAGQHAHDKVLYRAPGVAAGLQDAGFAYDRMIIDRDRLAIARVALPPAQQAPYLRRQADHHFQRGGLDAAERLIREALAVHPDAEGHGALVRYLMASPSSDETRFRDETRRWAELYGGAERLASVVYAGDRDADRPLRLPAEPPVARPPCQSKGVFVFASFAAAFRHNAPVLDVWARVLRDVPDTILYLKNSELYTPAYKAQVRDHFVTRGIAPDRLRLESASEFSEMLALYADVDLGLDTFPCSSDGTTTEALWQGVPTLTLLTEDWRGRTSAAILSEAGLSDFVARTPDEYVDKARHFARHPERLAAIRATIRDQLIARSRGLDAVI